MTHKVGVRLLRIVPLLFFRYITRKIKKNERFDCLHMKQLNTWSTEDLRSTVVL